MNHRGSVPEGKPGPPEHSSAGTLALTAAEDRWLAYLHCLATRRLTTADVASKAEQLWITLVDRVAAAVPPDASPTDNGGLLMSWDREGRHLEIEVLPDLSYEWFYRERLADVTENDDAPSVEVVSPELVRRLRQVLA